MASRSFTVAIAASSGVLDPRTMTRAQMDAATGLTVPVSSLTKRNGFTINGPGTYENLDITGRVTAQSSNGGVLTLRNCRINGGGDFCAFYNAPENGRFSKIRMENCEILNAQNCVAGSDLDIYRCKIKDWENGVAFWGPGKLVESYVYPHKTRSGAHYDGTECNGGGNIDILRCWIEHTVNQTSAVMFNNEFGQLHDIKVDGNYLSGGGYTIYFDCRFKPNSAVRCTVTNNTIRNVVAGPALLDNSGVVVNAAGGNTFLST